MFRTLTTCIAFIILALFLISCRAKPARVATPVPAGPDPKVQAQELVAQGDAHFQNSHLYGWRQAEGSYRKAYELYRSESTKDKLLVTRFLIDTRQADEDILDAAGAGAMASLCTEPLTPKQRILCTLAPRYVAGPGGRPLERPEQVDKTAFDLDQSALDAYLYTLSVRRYGIKESTEDANARWDRFGSSPLFIYLDFAKQVAKRGAELEKSYPQFAELYDQLGDNDFQKSKYNGARSHFIKVLKLIPDHTRALNGLGNLYLFALEDYEKAMQYYEASLKWDPQNTAALYGKGTVLHGLGKFQESNAALDLMLQSDLSRRGRLGAQGIRYFQGEGNFYKAYNFHLMGDNAQARELVDTAKRFIPTSDSVNYLSGLLYFEDKQYKAARDEFLKVLQSGQPNCDTQYYLGQIYRVWQEPADEKLPVPTLKDGAKIPESLANLLKKVPVSQESGERKAANYFLGSCSCMDGTVRSMKERISSIPSMDIEDAEKLILKGRLEKKLFNYRLTAVALTEGMLRIVADADLPNKKPYLDMINEILGRLRPAATNP